MSYEYKMIDIPSEIDGKALGAGAEKVLEKLVNHYARKGWEFVALEKVDFAKPPFFLFFWKEPEIISSRFVVLRREWFPGREVGE